MYLTPEYKNEMENQIKLAIGQASQGVWDEQTQKIADDLYNYIIKNIESIPGSPC